MSSFEWGEFESPEPLHFIRPCKDFNCLTSLPMQNRSFLDQRECYIVLVDCLWLKNYMIFLFFVLLYILHCAFIHIFSLQNVHRCVRLILKILVYIFYVNIVFKVIKLNILFFSSACIGCTFLSFRICVIFVKNDIKYAYIYICVLFMYIQYINYINCIFNSKAFKTVKLC